MPSNPNWPKWIVGSCRKHFSDRRSGIYLHFEGAPRDTLQQLTKYGEFRLNGPQIQRLSPTEFKIKIAINIMLSWKFDGRNLDGLREMEGIFEAAFTPSIEFLNSDGEKLGCFEQFDEVRTDDFGIVDTTLNLQQSTVQGQYVAYLENSE